jgi:hypothetical protein
MFSREVNIGDTFYIAGKSSRKYTRIGIRETIPIFYLRELEHWDKDDFLPSQSHVFAIDADYQLCAIHPDHVVEVVTDATT